jgi:hypothetical protein
MNQEFDSLTRNLEEAKGQLSTKQVEKIEKIHQGIAFLMEIHQDELEGRNPHMRIPRLLQPEKTLYTVSYYFFGKRNLKNKMFLQCGSNSADHFFFCVDFI